MQDILSGLVKSMQLLLSGDAELYGIILLSLRVSGIALAISTVLGIPFGAWMGLKRFFGRGMVIGLLYTGMGFPPVVVGLFVYLLLSQR